VQAGGPAATSPKPGATGAEGEDVDGVIHEQPAGWWLLVEELARVYAESLFKVALDRGKLDAIHDQLGAFADAVAESRDLQVFLFSPYFSSVEKRDGIGRVVSGAEPELINFLELLAEKHRMPVIFRIRSRFDELWAEENKQLEVRLTSAIELDPEVVERVGAEIERQTDRKIELEAEVDSEMLGGLILRVGNMVVDASLRGRLEKLRKEVAQAV
jgi:F-type H+-transporting ATPase subunit delta